MQQERNCIFCKIVRGEAPAARVYEDAYSLAFMDIFPAAPGHTLIIPKPHFKDLLTIDSEHLNAVSLLTQRIARAIHRALAPDGMRISQLNGAAAGQTVFHYHVHIIPLREGQRLTNHGKQAANPEEMQQMAAQIRTALTD